MDGILFQGIDWDKVSLFFSDDCKNVWIVNLSGFRSAYYFIWCKMPAVLRCMFFLLSDCLSVALTQSQDCLSSTDADKASKEHYLSPLGNGQNGVELL